LFNCVTLVNASVQANLDLPEISVKIMEVFETKDRATISELTGTNINAINKHLSSLVENNYLIKPVACGIRKIFNFN